MFDVEIVQHAHPAGDGRIVAGRLFHVGRAVENDDVYVWELVDGPEGRTPRVQAGPFTLNSEGVAWLRAYITYEPREQMNLTPRPVKVGEAC